MARKTINTELGTEIQCAKCKAFFPADREFFYSNPSHKLGCHSWCKACYKVFQKRTKPYQKKSYAK